MIVLVIIAILAIIAVCVLFVPIRYRAQGNIDEMSFDIKLHWFLKIIMLRFRMKDGSLDYALYLLGIRTKLLDKEAMERRSNRRKKRKEKKAARKYKSRKKKYQKEHDKYKEQFLKANQLEDAEKSDSDANLGSKVNNHDFSEIIEDDNTSTTESGSKKAMTMVKKAAHILNTIWEHHPIQMLWVDIQKILNHAKPRKVKADIVFGFEDPSTTGKILGAISNLYFIYQYEDLHITGDFEAEEAYISGCFDFKGYVQALFGLIFILRVVKKKQFRRFLKALKL